MKHLPRMALDYIHLMRFHKPIGILLLLWPTLTALWLATDGLPPIRLLIVFIFGVVVMRAAGCVINDIADRHVDGHVRRTKQRPLAQKKISLRAAWGLFSLLIGCAVLLVLQLNFSTQLLAIGALLLAILYPFVKRVSHFPQVVLGAAFGWAIPMAFSATIDFVPWHGWWFFIAMLLWTVAYDTQYAMADKEDDLKIGVKSTAIAFGSYDTIVIAGLQWSCLLMLLLLGIWRDLSAFYYGGLGMAAAFAVYQQQLIRDRHPQHCFKAFLNNHYFGLSVFLGVFMDRLYVSPLF